MTGFRPDERSRVQRNCVECGVIVCKTCNRCHTFHCNAEQMCSEDEEVKG